MSKKIYNELPFSEKLKLLNKSKNGVFQRALADKYKISKCQVCNILKRKEDVIYSSCENSKLSRDQFNIRKSALENINILTFEFFVNADQKISPLVVPY